MNKKLYPIEFKGKTYYEKDCDELFSFIYNQKGVLNEKNGVCIVENFYVYPDGSFGSI